MLRKPIGLGVIEAATIEDAAQRLIRWNAQEVEWADYVPSDPQLQVLGPDEARVSYQVRDTADKEREGSDIYVIRPLGSDIFMYLAQDWNLVFD